MNERLKALYQNVILQHQDAPVRFRENAGAQYRIEAYNPLCGDRFVVYFDVRDGLLTEVSFHGYGCAISKASTSVLVKHLEGLSPARALEVCREFLALLQPGAEGHSPDEEFEAFTAAREFPGRLTCATLGWEPVAGALEALDE